MQNITENDITEAFEGLEKPKVVKKKEGFNPNNYANAIKAQEQIIFVAERFYLYKDGRYTELSDLKSAQLIKRYLGKLFTKSRCENVKYSLSTDVQREDEELNQLGDLINFKNCVYSILDNSTRDHSSEDLFTIQIDTDYSPEKTCPKWLDFLGEMLGDDNDKIMVLQEYLGYCMDYKSNIEKFMFFVGSGANGKSVVCDVILNIFGKINCASLSLDDLRNKHYLTMLYGKLVNIATESQSKAEVYESVLKRLASSERITVDRKFQNPFEFTPKTKHIFSINNLPRIADKSDAFYRRIIPIPFNKTVQKDKIIYKLGERIAREEAQGVLNWMLEGLARLKGNEYKFTESTQVTELINEYKRDNNNTIDFIEECLRSCEYSFLPNQDIYEAYQKFCKDSGVSAFKKKTLLLEVEKHGFKKKRSAEFRGFEGVRLIGRDVAPF